MRINVLTKLTDGLGRAAGTRWPVEKVKEVVDQIEASMLQHFGHESETGYKTKYKSLLFNLSDATNTDLIDRVLSGAIPPDQLVQLPTSALANTKLKQEREAEYQKSIINSVIEESEIIVVDNGR